VRVPVLAIWGEKDLQVPPAENRPAVEAALRAGGNQNVECLVLPGLNHLLQTAGTGGNAEYGAIEETIAPVVLDKLVAWMSGVPCR
jgi:pimeloyl-ACP methyl ester carboxylesterase